MGVRIEVIASRDRGATEVKVTEGLFTFVALDEEHRPAAGRPGLGKRKAPSPYIRARGPGFRSGEWSGKPNCQKSICARVPMKSTP